jgi:hypothetical protein
MASASLTTRLARRRSAGGRMLGTGKMEAAAVNAAFFAQNGAGTCPVRQAGGDEADAFDPGGQRGSWATPRTRLQLLPPKPKELLRA